MCRLRAHARLALLVALTATFALPACDQAEPEQVDAYARPRPDLLPGTGNIYFGQIPELAARLNVIESLSLTAIRVHTNEFDGDGLTAAATIIEACRDRGIRVHFHVNDKVDSLATLSLDVIRDGGAAWGRFARDNEDVVAGFSILNEVDNQALAHEQAAGEGTPEGQAASQAVIDRGAEVIHAFAEGVRSEWDGGVVVPGGLAYPTTPVAAATLAAVAPDVRSGLLDGVGMHWYFDSGAFLFVDGQPTLRSPVSARADAALAAVGLPLDTPIYVQETSVRQSTFESPEDAGKAMRELLRGLIIDDRVKLVFPWGPWPSPDRAVDYTIQPGTPVGLAVTRFARQVRGLYLPSPLGTLGAR